MPTVKNIGKHGNSGALNKGIQPLKVCLRVLNTVMKVKCKYAYKWLHLFQSECISPSNIADRHYWIFIRQKAKQMTLKSDAGLGLAAALSMK